MNGDIPLSLLRLIARNYVTAVASRSAPSRILGRPLGFSIAAVPGLPQKWSFFLYNSFLFRILKGYAVARKNVFEDALRLVVMAPR